MNSFNVVSIIIRCICVGMYMCIHTHTHTHTYIYIYIYIYINCMYERLVVEDNVIGALKINFFASQAITNL